MGYYVQMMVLVDFTYLTKVADVVDDSNVVPDGIYSVPVKLMNATAPDRTSMGNAAIDGNATATVKGKEITYSINLKAVDALTLHGHVLEMWTYAADDTEHTNPIPVTVTETVEDVDIEGNNGTFVRTISFTRTGDAETQIWAKVHVDAMGDDFQPNVIMAFDWDNTKAVCDEHTTEIRNAKDATCTEAGYTGDEVCTVCGETETRSIPKLDVQNPFVDVGSRQYYYEPVLWAVNHDPQITNGTSATAFSPDKPCTRGQVVTGI